MEFFSLNGLLLDILLFFGDSFLLVVSLSLLLMNIDQKLLALLVLLLQLNSGPLQDVIDLFDLLLGLSEFL